MKFASYFIGLCLAKTLITPVQAQNWKPVPGKISTPWAEKLNPASPLPEYPHRDKGKVGILRY